MALKLKMSTLRDLIVNNKEGHPIPQIPDKGILKALMQRFAMPLTPDGIFYASTIL